MIKNLLLIVFIVIVNTTAQFTIKAGVNRIGEISIFHDFFSTIFKAFSSSIIISGFVLYFVSAILWIIILSRTELSWAYPMVSLSYVITVLVSPIILRESFSVQRLLGTLVICLGVFLVFRT